jgi:hypothetical protein
MRNRFLINLLVAAFPVLALHGAHAQSQPPISISPQSVGADSFPNITVTSSGFLDLSKVSASDVTITPAAGIDSISVGNQSAQSVLVSFHVARTAKLGERTLSIGAQGITVSLKFSVARQQPPPSACVPGCLFPRTCSEGEGECVLCQPKCTSAHECVRDFSAGSGTGKCVPIK